MIKEVTEKLLYALYPRRCSLCGEVVALDEELCGECLGAEMIEGELCRVCGNPKKECSCTKKTKIPEYKAFIAPYYYENSISAGANRFKDYGFPELSEAMGEKLSQQIENYYNKIEFDCITFVPLTKKKLRKRGYNQAQLLADEVSKHINIPSAKLLSKIRSTPQQKRISANQRKVNLRGAFDLAEGADVDDKTILLIDDIKTTGSTLNECAFVLNAYGAKAVYAASFCMTKSRKQKRKENAKDEK